MEKTYSLIDFIKAYYPDSNIPMYLFSDEKCIFCMPEQNELTYPPFQYLQELFSGSDRITHCTTEYGIMFCSLKVDSSENRHLVFGPVTTVPYSDSDLQHLYKDYMVSNDSRSDFNSFLRQIPCLSLSSLLKKCIFLNYCLHEEILSLEELTSVGQAVSENNVTSDASLLLEETYQKKENEQHNQTYILEEQLLRLVRTGDCEGFKRFAYSESNFHIGVTGSTALRQLKNNIIITTTLCTRAAIEGGLDYDTAYQLSDYFIQSSERLTSADRLTDLLGKVSYTFAEKVAQSKTPVSTDERMQKAIRYNQHLTVGDVADYAGFSKSYFSAYFKKTLGFSVSAFILRCKLEEGRELLQYTDKSISTISEFLCFSSQSHFHTAFRKQFGMTPSEYRKQQND